MCVLYFCLHIQHSSWFHFPSAWRMSLKFLVLQVLSLFVCVKVSLFFCLHFWRTFLPNTEIRWQVVFVFVFVLGGGSFLKQFIKTSLLYLVVFIIFGKKWFILHVMFTFVCMCSVSFYCCCISIFSLSLVYSTFIVYPTIISFVFVLFEGQLSFLDFQDYVFH